MSWQTMLRTGSGLGLRFMLVGIVPTAVVAVFLGGLIWSGAPQGPPAWDRLVANAHDLSAGESVLLILVVMLAAMVGEPLQRSMVRLQEGYWAERPRCPPWLKDAACWYQRRQYWRLRNFTYPERREEEEEEGEEGWNRRVDVVDDVDAPRRAEAGLRLRSRFPPSPDRVLPTALGNTLRAAEDRVGQQYGLDTVVMWPALHSVLPPSAREDVDDQRNQLDVAVRLRVAFFLCAVVSGVLLRHYPGWLFGFMGGALLASHLAYYAAVVAAEGYGIMIGVAFDCHRFDLLAALHLPLPANSTAELEYNRRLTSHVLFKLPLELDYRHPTPRDQEPTTTPTRSEPSPNAPPDG